ncbi:SDR family NAD(P)-dependent oxidoreductase [Pedobacter sp. N23S346]|uniref:SDR family NAD(P)-dependent oxidoreductase n=1 Tax=Pedobacter sp. N23S346 TaxID=3402750 RepID=UPI003AD1A78B
MKKAIITGVTGGIGLAVARHLAEQNYQLSLVARNEEENKLMLFGFKFLNRAAAMKIMGQINPGLVAA